MRPSNATSIFGEHIPNTGKSLYAIERDVGQRDRIAQQASQLKSRFDNRYKKAPLPEKPEDKIKSSSGPIFTPQVHLSTTKPTETISSKSSMVQEARVENAERDVDSLFDESSVLDDQALVIQSPQNVSAMTSLGKKLSSDSTSVARPATSPCHSTTGISQTEIARPAVGMIRARASTPPILPDSGIAIGSMSMSEARTPTSPIPTISTNDPMNVSTSETRTTTSQRLSTSAVSSPANTFSSGVNRPLVQFTEDTNVPKHKTRLISGQEREQLDNKIVKEKQRNRNPRRTEEEKTKRRQKDAEKARLKKRQELLDQAQKNGEELDEIDLEIQVDEFMEKRRVRIPQVWRFVKSVTFELFAT